jgi:stearoyl-CoA desaturase (delta-9 desaturase)
MGEILLCTIFFVFQGSSYLSPRAYAIMHRMHHAYADTELDPHSPKYDANLFAMMWRTRNTYLRLFQRVTPVDPIFTKELPDWKPLMILHPMAGSV